jgi:hypothetical protein
LLCAPLSLRTVSFQHNRRTCHCGGISCPSASAETNFQDESHHKSMFRSFDVGGGWLLRRVKRVAPSLRDLASKHDATNMWKTSTTILTPSRASSKMVRHTIYRLVCARVFCSFQHHAPVVALIKRPTRRKCRLLLAMLSLLRSRFIDPFCLLSRFRL